MASGKLERRIQRQRDGFRMFDEDLCCFLAIDESKDGENTKTLLEVDDASNERRHVDILRGGDCNGIISKHSNIVFVFVSSKPRIIDNIDGNFVAFFGASRNSALLLCQKSRQDDGIGLASGLGRGIDGHSIRWLLRDLQTVDGSSL